jgi:hypothetical protein
LESSINDSGIPVAAPKDYWRESALNSLSAVKYVMFETFDLSVSAIRRRLDEVGCRQNVSRTARPVTVYRVGTNMMSAAFMS